MKLLPALLWFLRRQFQVQSLAFFLFLFSILILPPHTSGPAEEPLPDGQHEIFYEDGPLKYRFTVKDGLLEGWSKSFRRNGTVESEGYYEKDHIRQKKSYYPGTDILQSIAFYEKEKLEGVSQEFDEEGRLKREITFHQGVPHGPTREYYEDGSLKIEWDYQNGKQGAVLRDYFKNGHLKMKRTLRGKRSFVTIYYESGDIQSVYDLDKKGRPMSFKRYAEGNKVAMEMLYREGLPHGRAHFYEPSGEILMSCEYVEGKQTEPCKAPLKEGKYLHGVHELPWKDGKAMLEFRKGKPDGLFNTYFKAGRLKSSSPYRNGKLEGVATYYYASGRVRAKETYVGGALQGLSKRFDEEGQLIGTIKYDRWIRVPEELAGRKESTTEKP